MEIIKMLKFFLLGILLAAVINVFSTCSKDDQISDPPDNIPVANETEAMKNLSENLISAFKSSDKPKLISFLNDECKEIYSAELNNSTADMSQFGIALEQRKLIFSSELYAEYEVTVNGETYTVAYGNCGDGNWKLLRF